MSSEACFAYAFGRVTDNCKVHYEIIIYKGIDHLRKTNYSNACFFTTKEIRNHIGQLQSIYPFKYSVRELKDGTWKVILDLEGVPGTFHKYALTWIRYLYEWPYNVLIKDAYRLKQDPIFRFESIANLFNLVAGCYCDYIVGMHSVMGGAYLVERLTRAALRAKIASVSRVNNLYSRKNIPSVTIPSKSKLANVGFKDFEYWTDDLFNEERKPVYLSAYNKIKK